MAYQKWKKKTTVDQLRVQWLRPVSTAQERCEIECDGDYSQDSLQYASLPLGAAKYDMRVLKYLMRMCHCHPTHSGACLLAHTLTLCIHDSINLTKVYLCRDACGMWKICTKWQHSHPRRATVAFFSFEGLSVLVGAVCADRLTK